MNFTVLLSMLKPLVDNGKVAGVVRAGVAGLIGLLISRWPLLSGVLDPATQNALGVAAAGLVVGIWSYFTKTDSAKIAAVAALPDVAKIVVKPNATNGVASAAADPNQPKVVTQ